METYEFGINPNTKKLLFEDVVSYKPENIASLYVSYIVAENTLKNNFFNNRVKKTLYKIKGVKKSDITFDKEQQTYTFKYEGEDYKFKRLSDCMNKSRESKELLSRKRQQKCHELSMVMCYSTPESRIVTGYINGLGTKVLHSIVVSTNDDGEEYACDWTKNLIMKYEDYKRIHNFEIVTEIEHEKVKEDVDSGKILGYGLSSKIYCVFRDQIIMDIDKKIR